MPSSIRNKLTAIAAIGAAALSGAAIAGAATSGGSGTSTTASGTAAQNQQVAQNQQRPPRDPSMGGHMANGETERLLTGETADKVEAAAKEKVPGGTIERVENDADTGAMYEAHVRKSDGSEVIVYVDKDFKVTGTDTGMGHP